MRTGDNALNKEKGIAGTTLCAESPKEIIVRREAGDK
jgi:hypothetical protein